jgi:uncharacterized protein YxjI
MLDINTYLVKEHVGMLKLTDTYDIFDAETGDQVGVAKEEVPGYVHVLRFLLNKQMLPTTVVVRDMDGERLFSIHRSFTFLRSKIIIRDGSNEEVGFFKSKLFSLGGGFYVFDHNGEQVAEVKGDWKGWNFRFLTVDGEKIGTVSKKWAGLAKELFTSADNYVIALEESVGETEDGNMLLLAAGLAIDIIYKEH